MKAPSGFVLDVLAAVALVVLAYLAVEILGAFM